VLWSALAHSTLSISCVHVQERAEKNWFIVLRLLLGSHLTHIKLYHLVVSSGLVPSEHGVIKPWMGFKFSCVPSCLMKPVVDYGFKLLKDGLGNCVPCVGAGT